MQKVSVFVDGFNFYHAIKTLRQNHLKWVDIRKLADQFAPSPQFSIEAIYYFSAYATWLPAQHKRHMAYIKALTANGVTPILGKFKEKDRGCKQCDAMWIGHEEKETDVNIALYLLDGAYRDEFDRALILSADSDLAPAIQFVKQRFPHKEIRILTPPNRPHSMELAKAAGGFQSAKKIKPLHIERSLFPHEVHDAQGNLVATRPTEYDLPV